MKRMLPVLASLLLALTACTGTPVSVLEKQAGIDELHAQHQQQLSAWAEEQAAIEAGAYVEPKVPLEEVFRAVREVDLIDDETLDNDGATMGFSNAGYFTVDTEYGAMGDGLEISGEHEPGTYWVVLACSGKGAVEIYAYADDQRLMKSSLECTQPMAKIQESFELKESAESLRVNIDPDKNVRGRYEFHLYG